MNEGYITVDEFEQVEFFKNLKLVSQEKGTRKRKRAALFDVTCAFDIETSTVYIDTTLESGEVLTKPHSFMYVWQFQFGEEFTVLGRTWSEFKRLMQHLENQKIKWMEMRHVKETNPLYVVYVHNLAYEWQYLQGVYKFENEDCFFRDVRKPIYCRLYKLIEFRCSYLHSNMSLSKFGESVGATVRKLDGSLFDYSKIRYPWTPLTDYEVQYCINDVKTLVESLNIEMRRDGDTLQSLPLTSTGYVRRDLKAAVKPLYWELRHMMPDLECYNLLRRCFRGGDTHANRYRVGTIQGPGGSLDIESSYPYTLTTDLYPMGEFWRLDDTDNMMDRILTLVRAGNAVIADYHFKGLKLKNHMDPMPYLPVSKTHPRGYVEDNGRIIECDMCVAALTEIDLMIVLDQYDYTTVSAYNVYTAVKAPLPRQYRKVVIDYYKTKTQLKKVPGKEYEYIKSKNKLNSCYGMAAQQSVHPVIIYDNEPLKDDPYEWHELSDEEAENELFKAHFPYQWGVYCTAYARRNLRRGMKLIPVDENGISRIIYCDTDSIKYVGPDPDFTELNAQIELNARRVGATAYNRDHDFHFMGKWDDDGHFKSFITQGAKRYAYIGMDDHLEVTVSGVTDRKITQADLKTHPELSDSDIGKKWKAVELGCLDNFKEGMFWKEAGGTAAVYNDTDNFYYVDPESGKKVRISPNVSIVDTTYTMTIEPNYKQILENVALFLRFCDQTGRLVK